VTKIKKPNACTSLEKLFGGYLSGSLEETPRRDKDYEIVEKRKKRGKNERGSPVLAGSLLFGGLENIE